MRIEIRSQTAEEGEIYEFSLSDGENETEKVRGYSRDLIHTFTKILEWRERISIDLALKNRQNLPGILETNDTIIEMKDTH
jgi:hypothetical protein